MRKLINKDLKKGRNYERVTKGEGRKAKRKYKRMSLYVHNIFSNCEQSVIFQSRLCYVANYRLMLERETVQNCGCRVLQRAFHFFGLAKTGFSGGFQRVQISLLRNAKPIYWVDIRGFCLIFAQK
jgi:hypothetical protein